MSLVRGERSLFWGPACQGVLGLFYFVGLLHHRQFAVILADMKWCNVDFDYKHPRGEVTTTDSGVPRGTCKPKIILLQRIAGLKSGAAACDLCCIK